MGEGEYYSSQPIRLTRQSERNGGARSREVENRMIEIIKAKTPIENV